MFSEAPPFFLRGLIKIDHLCSISISKENKKQMVISVTKSLIVSYKANKCERFCFEKEKHRRKGCTLLGGVTSTIEVE